MTRAINLVLALLLAFWGTGAAGDARAEAKPYGTQQLVRVDGNRVAVVAAINRLGPFVLMVDTATSHTILTPKTRDRLGLVSQPGPPSRILTAAGSVVSSFYRVDEVAFAGAIIEGLDAVVINIPDSVGIDGIVGADFLVNFMVDLDFSRARLSLYPAGSAPPGRDLRRVRGRVNGHGLIILPGKIERAYASFVIDTGAQVTIANPFASMATGRSGNFVAYLTDSKVGDIANLKREAKTETFQSVSVGPMTWRETPVLISKMRIFDEVGLNGGPVMFIGTDMIAGRRVAFDYETASVWIAGR